MRAIILTDLGKGNVGLGVKNEEISGLLFRCLLLLGLVIGLAGWPRPFAVNGQKLKAEESN